MKKFICLILTLLLVGGCTPMNKDKTAGETFKEEYESLNGLQDIKYPEYEYRTVNIDADNPYVLTTIENVIKMIDNKESFYLYFGDPKCPWCRSNIETAVSDAKEAGISTIYYIHMWDDERNEIIRDKYEVVDGEVVETVKGAEGYEVLLYLMDSYLNEYIVQDEEGNSHDTDEKRIVMPSYVHFSNGVVDKYTEGTATSQNESHEELSEEMIGEQDEQFTTFFNQTKACSLDSKGC